jgi:hypothetical protein
MDISYLVSESELLDHTEQFGFVLQAGNDEWKRQLQGPWTTSTTVLEARSAELMMLRGDTQLCTLATSVLTDLKESEAILRDHIPSEVSKSADGQIFFTGEHTKVLNHIPFLIMTFVFLKIWVAPFLALLTPLILVIMPYIIMTSIMDMPIPWETYVVMMKHMVFGIQGGEPWRMKHYGQAIWTFISMAQGILTPFFTAYHTAKLDAILVKRGEALSKVHRDGRNLLYTFQAQGILRGDTNQFPEIPTEPREIVAWMDAEPLGMRQIWRLLGKLTVMTRIATDTTWQPVNWITQINTLTLTNVSDIAISESKAVKSTFTLNGHSLLTGPNRGGKSSALRSILQQILLGQTFGFTKGCQGSWLPFGLVFTRLKSRDSAGKESLFEMEVRMASKILHTTRSKKVNTLVLIDELFHSTNPPDAETSAKLFLHELWKLPYCKSIISTHIFSLCKSVSNKIQTLCCPATLMSSGKLKYSYKLQPGICYTSSVKEVLEEAGLIRSNVRLNTTEKRT